MPNTVLIENICTCDPSYLLTTIDKNKDKKLEFYNKDKDIVIPITVSDFNSMVLLQTETKKTITKAWERHNGEISVTALDLMQDGFISKKIKVYNSELDGKCLLEFDLTENIQLRFTE